MRAARSLGIAGTLALAASCTMKPSVSDTGYQGTWSRGNDRVRSTIAIVVRDETIGFRWNQRLADGTVVVRCGWEGRCDGLTDGKKTSEYEFRAWIEPSSGKLRVDARHNLFQQDLVIHWIDELTVGEGGTSLLVETIERDGVTFDGNGPRYGFVKDADRVLDPPGDDFRGTRAP